MTANEIVKSAILDVIGEGREVGVQVAAYHHGKYRKCRTMLRRNSCAIGSG
jgi:hypothetical protein